MVEVTLGDLRLAADLGRAALDVRTTDDVVALIRRLRHLIRCDAALVHEIWVCAVVTLQPLAKYRSEKLLVYFASTSVPKGPASTMKERADDQTSNTLRANRRNWFQRV